MAKTFTLTAVSNEIYAKLVVTEQSQSVENNTTTLLWQIYMWNTKSAATENWYAFTDHNIFRVRIGGVYVLNTEDFGKVSLQYAQTESTATLITSGTTVVSHGSDGSKSVDLYFYAAQGWVYAYEWEASQSGAVLTTIARATVPTLSASSVKLGESVTISTVPAISSFTHKLTYSIGSASGTIGTSVGTSYPYTPSKTLAAQFPNSASGTVTITCETYNGSTLIGTQSVGLTVSITDDMVPTCSAVISEAVTMPSGITGYIRSRSKLKIDVTAAGSYGSTITTYKIAANGSEYTGKASVTTEYLTTAGTNKISVTVTDSRGKTASAEYSVTVIDYSAPAVKQLSYVRCDADGTENAVGEYALITVAGRITSLSGQNGKSCAISTKASTASTWNAGTIDLADYEFTQNYLMAAAIDGTYNVKVVLSDSFSSSEYYLDVLKATPWISRYEDGSGMGIHSLPDGEGITCGWPLKMKDGSEIIAHYGSAGAYNLFNAVDTLKTQMSGKQDALTDYVVAYGTSGIWTYLKLNSGIALCWGNATAASVAVTSAWGSMYIKDDAIAQQTLPFTFVTAPEVVAAYKKGISTAGDGWLYSGSAVASTTMTPSFGFARATSAASVSVSASLFVAGRWK